MSPNTLLTFLRNVFAKVTQIGTFLITTDLRKCVNFMFNKWCYDRGEKIIFNSYVLISTAFQSWGAGRGYIDLGGVRRLRGR